MRLLGEVALAACPPLEPPLQAHLLHQRAYRHVHRLRQELVALPTLVVGCRGVPLRLDNPRALPDRGAAHDLDRLRRLAGDGLGAE